MHSPSQEEEFSAIKPETVEVPEIIPIFPLPKTVLLPAEVLPLHIFEPRYRTMVKDALASHRVIGIVEVLPDFEDQLPGAPPVREIGCVGFIASHEEMPDGRFLLWLLGLERFRILEEMETSTPYRQVRVQFEPTPESPKKLAGIRQLRQEMRDLIPDLVQLEDATREQFARHMATVSDAQLIALACQILEINGDRKQEILEAESLTARFLMLYEDLYRHLDVNPDIDLGEDQLH